ncbi:metal ABC transporter permease [Primorskyibacter flagellatus]|uniref:Manganese/zinc/iron transport system permease protein n=1 Tax=Primorskyibacter flagellatus TaxID=1387277 RepID=A0A1W2A271_9RHOB|nr:iron chelate uptake ABC transporter family permease subunit [Primorskyibacter flagellatus]SMC54726.1 manganese/zinc/iron transport system permease protein [Primorskyibacter flagellatus]
MLRDALLLQMGYNATLVALGAASLGVAAGATGTFLFLRKRSLVSDAISHATLPGIGLAFLVMVALGGDGRWLPGLLAGSALSALAGLLCVTWLTRHTRLAEDAAIGAVLSVFFGAGIVILTVIQTLSSGRQAGLETFLLGSTAGMLFSDALTLAIGGALVLALALLLRRPMIQVAFDPGYAETAGTSVSRTDFLTMALVMAITVVGLKIVGLIMIVALLIIPAVTARFWTNRAEYVVALAGLFGGLAGYVGAAISATAPALPTGPIIVLIGFALFVVSLLVAPGRGVLAAGLRYRRFQRRVHLRQGLISLAQGQPVYERMTRRLLLREGFLRADNVITEEGRARAAKVLRDETRWQEVRRSDSLAPLAMQDNGMTDIASVLTADQLAEIDRRIGGPKRVTA